MPKFHIDFRREARVVVEAASLEEAARAAATTVGLVGGPAAVLEPKYMGAWTTDAYPVLRTEGLRPPGATHVVVGDLIVSKPKKPRRKR
jgi:hypothetical protein